MRKTFFAAGLAVFLVLFLESGVQAFEIFLWQHDNGLRVSDPVYRTSHTATDALARTMNDLDLDYTRSTRLPEVDDLSEYDIMVTSLSFYCPG